MIASLTGKVETVSGQYCILEVGGVGFQIHMPLSALETLSRATEPVKVYTHFHLREDGASLYGFLNPADKAIFEKIINVSGVGPKIALAILGSFSGERFREAIQTGDDRILTSVSGVGLKTAQRLILELKGKLGSVIATGENGSKSGNFQNEVGDAVDALVALGYQAREAAMAVDSIRSVDGIHGADARLTTPEIVRRALRDLARK